MVRDRLSNILLIIILVFTSCKDYNFERKNNFQFVENNINKYYLIKNVTSHFPQNIEDKNIISSFFASPAENTSLAEVYIIKKFKLDEIRQIKKDINPIFQSNYSDSNNFFIDNSWFRLNNDTSFIKYLNKVDNKIPIPIFTIIDFNLGYESYMNTIENDKKIYWERTKCPEDLEVFVLDSRKGNFWKNKIDSQRHKLLNSWQHGYSKGIAISQETLLICYWLIIW